MTGRWMLRLAAGTVMAFGLYAGVVGAANECKKDCAAVKKDCIRAAVEAKKNCTGDKATCKATFKTAKKACIDAFKAGKTACKTTPDDTNVCSPSGAFLD